MALRMLQDQISRYRLAGILLTIGVSLGIFTDIPLWIARATYLPGLLLLLGSLTVEAWQMHKARKEILDAAYGRTKKKG